MKMKEYLALHKKNRERVRRTISTLDRSLNASIRRHEDEDVLVKTRFLILLWVAYLEVSLNCILHSANQLSYDNRRSILSGRTLLDRWRSLLDVCFSRYYLRAPKDGLSKLSLGNTHYHRYAELGALLSERIAPLIEVRNRLAHGQWHVAFNNEGTEKSQAITTLIWRLTKKDVIYTKAVIHNTVALLTELTCSQASFEKKYDSYLQKIEEAVQLAEDRFQRTMAWLEKSQRQRRSLGYF